MTEPGGEASLQQVGKTLARLSATNTKAVSQQNRQTPDIISDTLRRKNRGNMEFSETQASAASAAPAANPATIYELPSTMQSVGQVFHPSSSFSRKRPRTGNHMNNGEQQKSPTILGLGLQRQQQQQQQHRQQHEKQQTLPSRTTGGASQPQPQPQQLVEGVRFREYQAEIWSVKFEELRTFRRFHGHCHVPHHYDQNTSLAQWVKRQRYQCKLKADGKRSTLSDERVRLLNKIGFIWNSHDAVWEERLQNLFAFKREHGHCIVPSNFDSNPQLAVWTKRQRRQYKKYQDGTSSSMTPERMAKLENIGFVWDCRRSNRIHNIRGDPPVVQRPNDNMGTMTGVGNLLNQINTSNINIGMNRSPMFRASGQISPNVMDRRDSSVSPNPIGGGNDQSFGAYNNQQAFAYSSNSIPRNTSYSHSSSGGGGSGSKSNVGLSTGSSLAMGGQGYTNDVANYSTNRTDYDNAHEPTLLPGEATTGLERVDGTRISDIFNGLPLMGNQQPDPAKTPRCDFFSFSWKYSPPNMKKPP